ncbi:ankyrin repeat domain-containing protein [Streptomyces mesophilus]|uniref:ankyrin repeat domain-containing protein n=1 Tax=Streptomyces mesophilus TaxID=1775132 RepID=UPI003325AC6F
MGFFDDLVLPEEPAPERTALVRLGPPGEDEGRYGPPVDRFAPAVVPQLGVVGAGPETRVIVTGWSVWPGSVTLHLSVFRRTRWQSSGRARKSGLRVGVLLADGRRVTSLDGMGTRDVWYTDGEGRRQHASSPQAFGLIPLDPGMQSSRRSLFKTDVDLYLPELLPPGETQLVVEWPDEEIPETRTAVDTAALRDAAAQAVEVWPGLEPPDAVEPSAFVTMEMGGPPNFLAPPLSDGELQELRSREEARQRAVPRPDWEQLRAQDWADTTLLRARLDAGAALDTKVGWPGTAPLHLAAAQRTAAAVVLLLSYGADPDVRDDDGHTPLWHAVYGGREEVIRALLDAGADVWTPQLGPWSPGRLLLSTPPLAPLVADLPGAQPLSAEEAAAFRAADELIAAFGTERLWTEGLGIAFVRGLDEDEVIRRLGADPADCPRADIEGAPFDEDDYEESLRYVGVLGVPGEPGGCVITQDGYLPNRGELLEAVSAGTTAYGIYYNPKGGNFGTLARDGRFVDGGEIGSTPYGPEPEAAWHFRFRQRGSFPYGADTLAYACGQAGMRITDGRAAVDRYAPRRWVRLPEHLQD